MLDPTERQLWCDVRAGSPLACRALADYLEESDRPHDRQKLLALRLMARHSWFPGKRMGNGRVRKPWAWWPRALTSYERHPHARDIARNTTAILPRWCFVALPEARMPYVAMLYHEWEEAFDALCDAVNVVAKGVERELT